MLSHVNMHDIDNEMAKDLKIVQQIDEGRQQNFRYVNCNDNTVPLEGISIDNFLCSSVTILSAKLSCIFMVILNRQSES
jgi:hypothetical protein